MSCLAWCPKNHSLVPPITVSCCAKIWTYRVSARVSLPVSHLCFAHIHYWFLIIIIHWPHLKNIRRIIIHGPNAKLARWPIISSVVPCAHDHCVVMLNSRDFFSRVCFLFSFYEIIKKTFWYLFIYLFIFQEGEFQGLWSIKNGSLGKHGNKTQL